MSKRSQVVHSIRVAAVAAALIALVYVALSVVFDVFDSAHLVAQVDSHLADRLADAVHHGVGKTQEKDVDDDKDVDAAPVVLWRMDQAGHPQPLSDGAPRLPATYRPRSSHPVTAEVANSPFRLMAIESSGRWLIAGQSLSETDHVENVLGTAEIVAGPVVILAMFLGALAIALKASGPVEHARRRLLEFTADASHELRTPLSVIGAEVDLALGTTRDAQSYRQTIERVRGESGRLRHIVDDLLWLARSDSEPPPPGDETVDLLTVAEECADRFAAIARSKNLDLCVEHVSDSRPAIKAPRDWIDRLAAVLVDNACRYSGAHGRVSIMVSSHGNRAVLAVEDNGPGISPEERSRLFDRFHRATDEGGGAGLGLAIADTIVRATSGRWRVGGATAGGARFEVSWHRTHLRLGGGPAKQPQIGGNDEQPQLTDQSA